MSKYILGTVGVKGNSDVIFNAEFDAGPVDAGLVCAKDSNGKLKVVDSGIAVGVAAPYEGSASIQPLIESGKSVVCQLDEDNVPALGGLVYATKSGKITGLTADTVQINATVKSGKVNGYKIDKDGTCSNAIAAIIIDFANGL